MGGLKGGGKPWQPEHRQARGHALLAPPGRGPTAVPAALSRRRLESAAPPRARCKHLLLQFWQSRAGWSRQLGFRHAVLRRSRAQLIVLACLPGRVSCVRAFSTAPACRAETTLSLCCGCVSCCPAGQRCWTGCAPAWSRGASRCRWVCWPGAAHACLPASLPACLHTHLPKAWGRPGLKHWQWLPKDAGPIPLLPHGRWASCTCPLRAGGMLAAAWSNMLACHAVLTCVGVGGGGGRAAKPSGRLPVSRRATPVFAQGRAALFCCPQEASLAEAEEALAANKLCGTHLLDLQQLAAAEREQQRARAASAASAAAAG